MTNTRVELYCAAVVRGCSSRIAIMKSILWGLGFLLSISGMASDMKP